MRTLARSWDQAAIVQPPLAQLPWYHHLALIEKSKGAVDRLWYAATAVERGWSRNVLVDQIDVRLMQRQGLAVTNFEATLPAPESALAREFLKDPYVFEFLGLGAEAEERAIEKAMGDPAD
ncbi:hypothetical protein AXK60_24475 [Tsukamurella pseudospumae]|uniref:YhcG N-terminal domain-containing protein n=2 Tax=Tsukamurella pseudospumae TaxID=239498 RepID=A0A138AND2_9ACTN|nr:hypothetical protein AXK60_24475 [Tsukamurella pseudospumae]